MIWRIFGKKFEESHSIRIFFCSKPKKKQFEISNIMTTLIKILDKTKILDKSVFQVGTPPIDYDTILLEDESGYMTQEISGQIALEIQN